MTTGKIFLVDRISKALTPMTETGYINESDLQRFLADYSDLLPGDQIDPESPRRWLLVAREMSVPGDVDETGRWSLDHLFLDQDGIPTFVECKRSQDTRARREVVAQMLDYAANGIEYWSIDTLRQSAFKTAQLQGVDLDQIVAELLDLDDERTIESYWQTVEQNLRSGKVRLIFVLDQSTKELRRLVEFLNEKMSGVEVLIVEIRQFVSDGQTALVPRVLGMTEQARIFKSGSGASRTKINEAFVFETCSPDARPVFEQMLKLAVAPHFKIYWGTKGFSVRAFDAKRDQWFSFAYGWPTNNNMTFYLSDILQPEEIAVLRQNLMDRNIFKESGNHTLSGAITVNTAKPILHAYEFMLKKIKELLPPAH